MQYFKNDNLNYKQYEKIANDKVFKLEEAVKHVVNDYDPYLGTVEDDEYESLNYYIVTDYLPLTTDIETLDLSWMDKNDVINIKNNGLNQEIQRLNINIDNLFGCHITDMNNHVDLIIANNNSKESIFSKHKALNEFLKNNKTINSVLLTGFNPIENKILETAVNSNNIELVHDEQYKTR